MYFPMWTNRQLRTKSYLNKENKFVFVEKRPIHTMRRIFSETGKWMDFMLNKYLFPHPWPTERVCHSSDSERRLINDTSRLSQRQNGIHYTVIRNQYIAPYLWKYQPRDYAATPTVTHYNKLTLISLSN